MDFSASASWAPASTTGRAAAVVVGALAQKSRLCMVGGIRDTIMLRDAHLLWGFIAIFAVVLAGNLILGNFKLGFDLQPIAHSSHLWNLLGMVLVGWGSVLLGGCPLRQLILAGSGNGDSAVTVFGMIVGAAFAHNFALAGNPDALNDAKELVVGGIGTNGKIAVAVAESVKMALTSDADLLDRIERSADLTAGLPEIIARSLTIKKNVVEQDPHEHGLRRVLNFGHTVGHAIESSAGGRLLHGECVALGMLPMCAPALRPRLIRVLRKCGLPTEIETTREALLPYLRHDKKGQGAAVTAVEVDEPGSFRFTTMMPEEILHRLEGVLL